MKAVGGDNDDDGDDGGDNDDDGDHHHHHNEENQFMKLCWKNWHLGILTKWYLRRHAIYLHTS